MLYLIHILLFYAKSYWVGIIMCKYNLCAICVCSQVDKWQVVPHCSFCIITYSHKLSVLGHRHLVSCIWYTQYFCNSLLLSKRTFLHLPLETFHGINKKQKAQSAQSSGIIAMKKCCIITLPKGQCPMYDLWGGGGSWTLIQYYCH